MSVYQGEAVVRISDCDGSGRWRPSALLVDMQELGEVHATTYGLSRGDLLKDGMCWVLYRQRVQMRSTPGYNMPLRITTWPGAIEGPIFPRYFVFEHQGGKVIGEAVTAWVLMDVKTRRPLRPSALLGKVPVNRDRAAPMPLPGILRLENAKLVGERSVCYSDVDVNGHMNNTRYIDWICDLLPYPELIDKGLASWQVNYISEARPGETIGIYQSGGMFQGKRASDGRTVFDACVALNG